MQLGEDGLLLATAVPSALPAADLSSTAKAPGSNLQTSQQEQTGSKNVWAEETEQGSTALTGQETFLPIILAWTGKALWTFTRLLPPFLP